MSEAPGVMSEDFARQLHIKCERLRSEKNELLLALRELLTKPACSSCIRTAQELSAKLTVE